MVDYRYIEQIQIRAYIKDIIESYGIGLHRKGRYYWCCCPFHGEKTASFMVDDAKNRYHCFGCGVSGDVINFVQEYEHIEFVPAVRKLAGMYGIEIEEVEETESERNDRLHHEALLALMQRVDPDCAVVIDSLENMGGNL